MYKTVHASAIAIALVTACTTARAQDQPDDQMNMSAPADGSMLMQDGIIFAEFDHQGAPRGGNQFVAPNWWMSMASREMSRGRVTFYAMFSLDPATVGEEEYRELFQVGEGFDGRTLIDRQHPHDLFMQLAAVWRIPISETTGFTLAGGPVGEPALGPVAHMHRASAAGDHGVWTVEGSVFKGREPDQNRWDFDFGPLNSFSAVCGTGQTTSGNSRPPAVG